MRTNGNRFEGTLAFACLLLTLMTVYRTESKISESLRAQATAASLLDEHDPQGIDNDNNKNHYHSGGGRKLMRGGQNHQEVAAMPNNENDNTNNKSDDASLSSNLSGWNGLEILDPPSAKDANDNNSTLVALEPLRPVDYENFTLRIN